MNRKSLIELTIHNPQPCGFKDWIEEEGSVFWLEKEAIPMANFMWNAKELLEIFESDRYSEYFFRIENGEYKGELLG